MADQFVLVLEGLDALRSLDDIPAKMLQSARIAVNDAATKGRKRIADQVLRETAFPDDYVAPRNGRLVVKQKATNATLEAVISARTRATSLARFVKGSAQIGGANRKPGVRVEVNPGSVKELKRAFLIRLRAGSASLDTRSNLGLAVRTQNGRPPPGYKPKKIGQNLWLLYGPSVAQSLYGAKNNGGIATQLSPTILNDLEAEFWRQMDRK